MRLFITGGAGFIGSNFVRSVLRETDHCVTIFDALTYAGRLANLDGLATSFTGRFTFVRGDIADGRAVGCALANHRPDVIVNFAAESHVDRSIQNAAPFVRTNVLGVQTLLDAARQARLRLVQISTEEVYGSLNPAEPAFTEDSPLRPNSPYSASKAAGDLLCRAAVQTHQQDVVVTRCGNNFGPYQFPEKLIPLMIVRALNNEPLPVYGDGQQVRDWLHVEDHCRALRLIVEQGRTGAIYNIGTTAERRNLEVVRAILAELNRPESLIRHVADRPGHDRRYAVNASKLRTELGWQPLVVFEEGLRQTVQWYVENRSWWEAIHRGHSSGITTGG